MRCPELMLGSASYFAGLAVVVGAAMRIAKRWRWLPADATPVVAAFVGWAIDAAAGLLLCARPGAEAAVAGLAGALAGLSAAGGHEALARLLRAATGSRALGDAVLGRARVERAKRG